MRIADAFMGLAPNLHKALGEEKVESLKCACDRIKSICAEDGFDMSRMGTVSIPVDLAERITQTAARYMPGERQ